MTLLAAGTLGSTQVLLRSRAMGLALSPALGTRFSSNGDLLGFAYAWEQATHHRHPPVLVDRGLLPERR